MTTFGKNHIKIATICLIDPKSPGSTNKYLKNIPEHITRAQIFDGIKRAKTGQINTKK